MMSDNKPKCELCLKRDTYQMCPNCFTDISNLNSNLRKSTRQETQELRESLKELISKNKAKSSQLAQHFYTQILINRISNEISSITTQNSIQRERIGKIKQEIENKEKRIARIKEKLKEIKASPWLNINKENRYSDLMLCVSNRRIAYAKALFNTFVINAKAYIPINEYFISNDHYFSSMNINNKQKEEDEEMFHSIIKYENVMKICSETANGKFIIEDQLIAPTEVFPFKISPSVFKNRIKCIKLNRFLVAMMTFVFYSANKINICLPHFMDPFTIRGNKNNKTLNGIFEPALMRKNNLEDIMTLVNLLNQNYNALIGIIYDKQQQSENTFNAKAQKKQIELFNLTYLMTQEQMNDQLKRSNSQLLQLKTDTEVEGFVVLNDYFH